MSISGKTFLSAFQVGSRIVPDAIEGSIRRGKLDAEKVALELQNKVKQREEDRRLEAIRSKEMAIDELTSINDLESPDAGDDVKKILDKTGMHNQWALVNMTICLKDFLIS